MVGKVEETLVPVQGHFGLKEAIDHPREVVEGKNEHAHQCQGGEHLSGVRGGGGEGLKHHLKLRNYLKACSIGGPANRSVEGRTGSNRTEGLAG